MPPELIAIPIVLILFVGFPWVLFHYITKWKMAKTLTGEDETLLDELHDLARRLDDRMVTIERIVQAENPNWRALGQDPVETVLEDRSERLYESEGRSNRPSRRKS